MKQVLPILILLCGSCFATTRYVAQTAGTFSGGTVCNGQTAITYSTFNAASLSPNDLTYICGTITTNAAQIIPNGSGTSGNPITIKFDTGASFSPAACNLGGGSNICFNLNGLSWIVIDGGTPCGPGTACNSDEEGNVSDDTGVISNTANGVGQAHQVNSQAIFCTGCSHVEIRNLIIKNIYIESSGDTTISDDNVQCINYSGSNITIHDSTFHDAGFCVQDSWANGDGNNETYNLDIYNIDHGIVLSGNSGTSTGGPFWIHNNYIHAFSNWDAGSTYHHDAFHCWSGNAAGQTVNGLYIYNNTMGGPMGSAFNSFTYIEGASGPPCMNSSSTGFYFNNLLIQDATFTGTPGQPWQITGNWAIYNNTSLSYGNSGGPGNNFILTSDPSAAFINNVSTKNSNLVSMNSVSWAANSPDYNLYSLDGFSSSTPFFVNTGAQNFTFSGYKAVVGGAAEAHSVNPASSNISYTTGKPQAGSAAIAAGANLFSICNGQAVPGIGALCLDAAGVSRPTSGAWDIGAYQFQAPPPTIDMTMKGATVRGLTVSQ